MGGLRARRRGRPRVGSGHATLRDGDVFAERYQVGPIIGRGGSSTIYRVTDQVEGTAAALKLPHPDIDSEARDRFLREIAILARLDHPGLPRVRGFGTWEDQPFLVTNLIQGVDLRAEIEARGRLLPPRLARIGLAAANTLAATHDAGVVHGDIKSGNVMLSSNGEVTLIDFGIASEDDPVEALRVRSDILGTPEYMAPELFVGEAPDTRSDVYALGIVLYEALLGRVPFEGHAQALARRHAEEPPASPQATHPDIPSLLQTVVLRCLQKAPWQRYQTGADVAQALRVPLVWRLPGHRFPDGDVIEPGAAFEAARGAPEGPLGVLVAGDERPALRLGAAVRYEHMVLRVDAVEAPDERERWRYDLGPWPETSATGRVIDLEREASSRYIQRRMSFGSRLADLLGRTD